MLAASSKDFINHASAISAALFSKVWTIMPWLRNPALAALMLMMAAPVAVFNIGFLAPLPAALATIALMGGIVLSLRDLSCNAPLAFGTLATCVLVSLALVIAGGEGRFFYATDDWIIRDAVLGDLVQHAWPVAYERAGIVAWLRAPLGLYLAPALIGKQFGVTAAHLALIVQNSLLFGLILYGLIARLAGRERWITLGVFILFSGCDVIPSAIDYLKRPPDFEFSSLEMRYGNIEYVSHVTQLFWAPHHSIAGWGFVAGYLAWRAGHLGAAGLGALFALTLMWSPLAGLGALPLLAFAGLRDLWLGRLRPASLAAPALCAAGALASVIYMINDAGTVEKGWTFLQPDFLSNYFSLIGFEVLPFLLVVGIAPTFARDENGNFDRVSAIEFGLVAGLLLLLPLYWVHFTNDFIMRASIPAQALLALLVGRVIYTGFRDGFGPRRWIVPVFLTAAITPGFEIARSLTWPRSPASTCNLLDAWDTGPWRMWPLSAYLADRSTFDQQTGIWRVPGSILRTEQRVCPWEKPGT